MGGVARWVAGLVVVVAVVEQLLVTSIVEVGVVVPRVARGAAPGVRVLVDLRTVEVMGDSSAMYSWDYSDVRPPDLCQ